MSLKGKLRKNEQLAMHTSFNVGGPVQYWIEPKEISDLQNLVILVCKEKIPLRIIGAGSNILAGDVGIKGMVLKLNSSYFKKITVNSYPNEENIDGETINVGAGLSLAKVVKYSRENGLSGCELLAGIPGTVGGALIMNAGNIGGIILDVTVMAKQGRVKRLKRKDIQFSYRSSNLNHYIILSANLRLIRRNRRAINKKISEYLNYRRKTQDLSLPSAGCIFKNPSFDKCFNIAHRPLATFDYAQCSHHGLSRRLKIGSGIGLLSRAKSRDKVESPAAYLIEQCGLKGISFGDAAVSFKHANFIVNKGNATFTDITRLMAYITRYVKKRFNVDLEPEIKIWHR